MFVSSATFASTVASWTNASLDPGSNQTINAAVGTGTLSRGTGVTYNTNANTYSSTNWPNAAQTGPLFSNQYYQITVDTTGKTGMTMTFNHNRNNNNGPTTARVYYRSSTGPDVYTQIGSDLTVPNGTATAQTITLPAVTQVENNASATFRIHCFGAGQTTRPYFLSDLLIQDANAAPTISGPSSASPAEDTSFAFTGGNLITVADTDAGTGNLALSLSVTNGTLTFGSTTGLTFTTGTNGTASMTVSGTLTALNTALATLSYKGTSNYNGSDSLVMSVNDNGNTGTGGAKSGSKTITLSVSAVNDGPTVTVPGTQAATEDTAASISGPSMADIDAGGASTVQMQLTATNGTLTLGSLTNITITAGANGTSTFTIQGTITNINARLATLTYQGNSNFNGTDTITAVASDLGNTGTPGALTDTKSYSVTVSAVNDAPVVSVPSTQSASEDVAASISGPSISDVDAAAATVQMQLTAANGKLTYTASGTITLQAGANGTSTFTIRGNMTDLNATLATISYLSNANFNGTDTITAVGSDLGNSGAGTTLTNTNSYSVTVSAVNDAPVITVPGAQSANEDLVKTINGVSISDVDIAAGSLSVTLSVLKGSISLASTAGITINSGADGSASVSFTGNLTNVNAALNGFTYLSDLNYSGPDTLSISVDDLGNTGAGGPKTASTTLGITVNAVDDAPSVTVPATQSATEDVAASISGPSISDIDAGAASIVEMKLTAANGKLTYTPSGTITLQAGTNGSSTFTIRGNMTDLNATLATISYVTNTNFNGTDTITVVGSDLGNTGVGGPLTDTKSYSVTVSAVNDTPVVSVPATQSSPEDASTAITGPSVSDVDAGGNDIQLQLSAANGTITLASLAGLTVTAGSNGSASLTVQGPIATINARIASITYQSSLNFVGSDTITAVADDLGNSGSGTNLTDTKSYSVNVTAVDDAPSVTVPATQSATEDVAASISGPSISDIDAGAASIVEMKLTAANGKLTYTAVGTITLQAGANGTSTFTIRGTMTDLNATLATISYVTNTNFNGTDTITVVGSDLGNTGSGGPLTDTKSYSVTVSAVNDAPVVSVPGAQSAPEDVATAITGPSVSDVDAGGNDIQLQLSATSGTITLSSLAGLTVTGGSNGSGSLTVQGPIATINARIASITYQSPLNVVGSDTITAVADDLGNSGGGTNLTDTKSYTVNVTAVNDAPSVTVPATQSATEDVAASISGPSISDIDAGAASIVEMKLTAANGKLTYTSVGTITLQAGTNGSSTFTIRGTMTDLNATLATISYVTNTNFNGTDTITVVGSDLGNTGTPGALTDTKSYSVTVSAVNDAPVVSVPATQSAPEDASTAITGPSLSDPDAGTNLVELKLSVANGTLTLASLAGLTVTGGSNGSATITVQGTIANINTGVATLTYQSNLNFNGTDTVTLVANDLGNSGAGTALSDTKSYSVTVTAVNDGPSVSVPATQTATEDVAASISGPSISDIDAGAASLVQMQLTATNGKLTYTPVGTITLQAGTNGTSTFTIRGTITDLNATLATISYITNLNFNGTDTITVVGSDLGNTGSPGALTDTKSYSVTVSAVNDPPAVTVPGAQSVPETVATAIPGPSIADVDAGTNNIQLQLTATNGTITLSSLVGLTVTGGSNGSASLTVQGPIATINARVASITYQPGAGYIGPDSITAAANDLGNSGAGGNLTDTKSYSINVFAVNDPPSVSVPATQTATEDIAASISGPGISDIDAGTSIVQMQLTAANGKLTYTPVGSITLQAGTNGTSTFTIRGTMTDLNATLATITYQGNANFNGTDTITVVGNDLGNTGTGGPLTDTKSYSVTVSAVNDGPTVTVPGTLTVAEDVATAIAGPSIADVDSGTSNVQLQLSAANGTITLSSLVGLTVTAGANGSGSLTVQGPMATINTRVASITYQSNLNFNGSDTITAVANDLGNSGSGGSLSDTNTYSITVTAVNDPPLANVPATQSATEDSASAIAGPSISDVDAGAAAIVQMQLTAANGKLTYTPVGTITLQAGANNSSTFTIRGTIANLNATLASLSYLGNANFSGNDTISVVASDLGNTGAGGTLTNSNTYQVSVSGVNDAPVVTVPGTQSAVEDTSLALPAPSFADVDGGSAVEQLTVSAANGTITFASLVGLTVTGGANGSATVTVQGTIVTINTRLGGLSYKGNLNFNGADTVTVAANDLGNTGSGGSLTDSKSFTVNVSAVNDIPAVTVTNGLSTPENTPLLLGSSAPVISDPDAGSANIQVTLTLSNCKMSFGSTAGVTIVGPNSNSPDITGSQAAINAVLAAASVVPNLNFTGTISITVASNDLGNTGSGGAKTDSKTFTINCYHVNVAPVLSVPAGPLTMIRNLARPVSGVSIADTDAGTGLMDLTLSVTGGTLNLGTITGLTLQSGANNSAAAVWRGTLANLNSALGTLSYTGPATAGNQTLTITINDRGNTGVGGALSDTKTIVLNVVATSLVYVSSSVTGGNGNGVIDPQECNDLFVTLQNTGTTTGVILFATLVSNTPGVIVTNNFASYPDIAVGGTGANTTAYTISSTNQLACGADIKLTLVATAANGDKLPIPFTIPGVGTLLRFDNNGVTAIPDRNTVDIPIVVSGVTGTLNSVTVSLYATHPNDGDLRFDLFGPDGTRVTLANRRGGSGDNYGTAATPDTARTTFDSSAAASIASGTAPFAGKYRPEGLLTAFAGKSGTGINGTWRLRVQDTRSGNTGNLNAWSLNLNVSSCPGATGACAGTPTADLRVQLVSATDPSYNGGVLTYVLTAYNDGPDTVTQVTLIDYVAPELTFINGTATTGTVDGSSGAVVVDFGTLAPGTNETVTLNYMPNTVGTVTSSFALTGGVNDLNTNNNTVSATTDILPQADMSIVKTPSASTLNALDPLTYTIEVTNNGPDIQSTCTVYDVLPANFTSPVASSTSGTVSIVGGTLICSPGTMAAGDVTTITVTGTPLAGGFMSNTAMVTGQENDTNLGNNSSTAVVYVVNFPPVLDLNGAAAGVDTTASFTEAAGPVVLASSATVSDTNDANMTSATATITNLLDGTAESLDVNLAGTAISKTFNPATGVLLLTGSDTKAHYEQVLRTLTYDNSSATPSLANRIVNVFVFDGMDESPVAKCTITMADVNTPPSVLGINTTTTAEDIGIVMAASDLAIADPDAGGADLAVTLSAAHGTITLSNTGGLTTISGNGTASVALSGTVAALSAALNGLAYTPVPNYNGTDTLAVSVNDNGNTGPGGPQTTLKNVTIVITAVNDPPQLTVPVSLTGDVATTIPITGPDQISLDDDAVETVGATVDLTLKCLSGQLFLGTTTNLVFITGTNGSSDIKIRGSLADLNIALQTLEYISLPAVSNDIIQVNVDDRGFTGAGGPLTVTQLIPVTLADCTQPGIATNPTPANNATVPSSTAQLSFTKGTKALSFYVYFDGNLIAYTSNTTVALTPPLSVGAHTWRVDSESKCGLLATGPDWTFFVLDAVTSPVEPSDGARLCSAPTRLEWLPVSGATQYDVYIDEQLVGTTGNSYFVPPVVTAGAHTWRVDCSVNSVTLQSPTWMFVVLASGLIEPSVWHTDGQVYAVAVVGTTVYIAGNFTYVLSPDDSTWKPRNYIAALDAFTGKPTDFNPGANAPIYALAADGDTLYAGGMFTQMGGQPRQRLAAMNVTSNTGVLSWNPGANGLVRTMLAKSGNLYVGGDFTTVAGTPRGYLAELVTSGTGTVTTWAPSVSNSVYALAADDIAVYIGGIFQQVGGQTLHGVAAINRLTGVPRTWINGGADLYVYALALKDGRLYCGGQFSTMCGVNRRNLAQINPVNGTVYGWNPGADRNVTSLAIQGTTVFIGGAFTQIAGEQHIRLAGVHMITGAAVPCNYNCNNVVRAFAFFNNTLYAGGDFTQVDSSNAAGFAAIGSGTTLPSAVNDWSKY